MTYYPYKLYRTEWQRTSTLVPTVFLPNNVTWAINSIKYSYTYFNISRYVSTIYGHHQWTQYTTPHFKLSEVSFIFYIIRLIKWEYKLQKIVHVFSV